MAKVLLLEIQVEVKISRERDGQRPRGNEDVTLREKLESHALSIASICLSRHLSEGVRPVAVNPMFYGKSSPRRSQLLKLQPY